MSVLYISDAVLVDILEVIDRIGPLRTRAACRDGGGICGTGHVTENGSPLVQRLLLLRWAFGILGCWGLDAQVTEQWNRVINFD